MAVEVDSVRPHQVKRLRRLVAFFAFLPSLFLPCRASDRGIPQLLAAAARGTGIVEYLAQPPLPQVSHVTRSP